MKYEVTIDEQTRLIDIQKVAEQQYAIKVDNGEVRVFHTEQISANVISLLADDRSLDIGRVANDDGFEVEIKGERYLANVVDPRKKNLRMAGAAGGDKVITRMPGRVIEVLAEVGQAVSKGDVVVVVEAMKMENPLKAPRDGVVAAVEVSNGDLVEAKAVLLTLQ